MDLRARAEAWLAEDPDPDTRAELRALLDGDDEEGLAARFGDRLEFGTAGIRGPLGAGPARMNRAVVRRVTAGLTARLAADGPPARRTVVVGRDARHKSADFAADTAAVLAGAGFRVRSFADPVPTPLLAYAVRALSAAAGVQITASHNPPADNGYKVYWAGGAQIAPPLDIEIGNAIDAVGPLADVPFDPAAAAAAAPPDVHGAYLDAVARLPLHAEHRDLAIVYTPLHGVAGGLMTEALTRAGFTDVGLVPEQAQPDPDFPTVDFPNPEEPGALDLAFDLAGRRGADVVIANDPDGDRIAAAVPSADGWRPLSGDETGCLLADYLLSEGAGADRVVATTVVSSQLLARIAEFHGVGYAETLTGFKWLAKAAADAEASGRRLVLGYEQALGVMVGNTVRDKDGISAGVVFADLLASLKAQGRTALDALDDLARRFGVHSTAGRSVRLSGPEGGELVAAALATLRENAPDEIAGVRVLSVADHTAGVRRHADGTTTPLATPPTPLVGLTLADGSRLQVRPSGTEPLLKFYIEVVEPVRDGTVTAARTRAADRLERMADAFLQAAGVG